MLDNLQEGLYTLTITDANGCTYEKVFEIVALSNDPQDCFPLFVPNIFSPNNDGINDIFSIQINREDGISRVRSMQIYSRWGELVLDRKNFIPVNGNIGWDGYYNNQLLNPGVYIYKITLDLITGKQVTIAGDITLIR